MSAFLRLLKNDILINNDIYNESLDRLKREANTSARQHVRNIANPQYSHLVTRLAEPLMR